MGTFIAWNSKWVTCSTEQNLVHIWIMHQWIKGRPMEMKFKIWIYIQNLKKPLKILVYLIKKIKLFILLKKWQTLYKTIKRLTKKDVWFLETASRLIYFNKVMKRSLEIFRLLISIKKLQISSKHFERSVPASDVF